MLVICLLPLGCILHKGRGFGQFYSSFRIVSGTTWAFYKYSLNGSMKQTKVVGIIIYSLCHVFLAMEVFGFCWSGSRRNWRHSKALATSPALLCYCSGSKCAFGSAHSFSYKNAIIPPLSPYYLNWFYTIIFLTLICCLDILS